MDGSKKSSASLSLTTSKRQKFLMCLCLLGRRLLSHVPREGHLANSITWLFSFRSWRTECSGKHPKQWTENVKQEIENRKMQRQDLTDPVSQSSYWKENSRYRKPLFSGSMSVYVRASDVQEDVSAAFMMQIWSIVLPKFVCIANTFFRRTCSTNYICSPNLTSCISQDTPPTT